MTKPEITGKRDLSFSQWIRNNLPDSRIGFMVTDLDFILYNYKTKKVMLLEVKTRNTSLPTWQSNLFRHISSWIEKGINHGWQYLGFHIVTFQNTNFRDGKVLFDDEEVTEQELIKRLSF
jgi:hypothetical protein